MAGEVSHPGSSNYIEVTFSELDEERKAAVLQAVRQLQALGVVAHVFDPNVQENESIQPGRLYSQYTTVDGGSVAILRYAQIENFDNEAAQSFRTRVCGALWNACFDRRSNPQDSWEIIPAVIQGELADPQNFRSENGGNTDIAGIEIPVFLEIVSKLSKRELTIQSIGITGIRYLLAFSYALQQEFRPQP